MKNEKSTKKKITEFEREYGLLPSGYSRKLFAILERLTPEGRNNGLDVLALRAFANSPLQKLIQSLRIEKEKTA